MSSSQNSSQAQPANRGYSFPMRILHWLMAAIMIYVIIVGFMMGFGVKVGAHYDYHRAAGFLLMILVIIRLLTYRFTKAPSPLPDSISPTQKLAAETVHFSLYALLIIQPLLGWYATNAWGVAKIPFFFGWTLPRIVEKDRALGNYLLEIHYYVGLLVTALVLLHIAAALHHHFVKRDGLILRMLKS